jgi:hypothetical protein
MNPALAVSRNKNHGGTLRIHLSVVTILLLATALATPAFGPSRGSHATTTGPSLNMSRDEETTGAVPTVVSPSSQGAPYAVALTKYGNDVSWPLSTDSCFSYYGVSYFDPTVKTWFGPESFDGRSNTTLFATTDFNPGITYEYEVQDNDCGNVIGGTAFANITQPSGYYVSCSEQNQTSVYCFWNNNDQYGGLIGFYEYQLLEFLKSCGLYCGDKVYIANITSEGETTYTVNGLQSGTSYYFELDIVDKCTGPLPYSYTGDCDTTATGGPPYGTIYDGYSITNATTSAAGSPPGGSSAITGSDVTTILVIGLSATIAAVGVSVLWVTRRGRQRNTMATTMGDSVQDPSATQPTTGALQGLSVRPTETARTVTVPPETARESPGVAASVEQTQSIQTTAFGQFCPFCGARSGVDFRFCKHCGKELPQP